LTNAIPKVLNDRLFAAALFGAITAESRINAVAGLAGLRRAQGRRGLADVEARRGEAPHAYTGLAWTWACSSSSPPESHALFGKKAINQCDNGRREAFTACPA